MLGHRRGTAVRMDKVLGHELHKTWCNAHKLEVMLKAGFLEVPGSKEYGTLVNGIYSYYGPSQHKKRLSFKKFEKERKEKHHKFLKSIPTRWAKSHLAASERLFLKYHLLGKK